MVLKSLRPLSFLVGLAAMLLLALAGPASAESYGDPAIVSEDGEVAVEPGAPFSVTYNSNVECDWSSMFDGQTGAAASGLSYSATFTAPMETGTYEGTVVCEYATTADGPRDQSTSQTFTVMVGDAGAGDDATDDDDAAGASDTTSGGVLADTGGSNAALLALGAGLLVVGGAIAVAARRRKTA